MKAAILLMIIGVALWGCNGILMRRTVHREMDGLATAEMPKRMGPFGRFEDRDFVGFTFARIHTWAMGSNTPVREMLVVTLLAPNAGRVATERAVAATRNTLSRHVEETRWKSDGSGDGINRVNLLEEPTWMSVRTFKEIGLVIGYRNWKKDASLDEVRAMIDRVVPTIEKKPAAMEAVFRELQRDPSEIRAERLGFLDAELKRTGHYVPAPDTAYEKNGFYVSYTTTHEPRFAIAHAIGEYDPATASFVRRENRPAVMWASYRDGSWIFETNDHDYYPPPVMQKIMDRRHTDPTKHYFYTIETIRVDALEPEHYQIDVFMRTAPNLRPSMNASAAER